MHAVRNFVFLAICVAGAMPAQAGQSVINNHALRFAQGTACTDEFAPVCATKNGKRVTYSNSCKARVDGATDITPGACEATK
jgi:hypothetical protein